MVCIEILKESIASIFRTEETLSAKISEVAGSSNILVPVLTATQYHIPVDHNSPYSSS
jgi:hypothetical protein